MPAFSGIELKLSDNRTINVDLAEARLISELKGYAIIAGRTCVDCDENTAIFLEKIDGDQLASQPRDTEREEPPEPQEFAALDELGHDSRSDDRARDRAQADTDGVVDVDLSGERFSYPGQYRDYLTKELVEKTRMFYGHCHENSPALLWLTEYRTEKGWVKEEYLLVFRDEGVEHRYNQSRQPSIYYIKNERCRELPGISVTTEP
ncbi:hypothetical protein [Microbulbifer sp. ALW1]|uniref:hypothetical protein n=1 Tax=Microbulbifer sp. (strain ALW1) TaxID=1516059 RepID=UPI0013598F99|nr:hypothetical protein [Microbulbifer sp. ALW1]